MMFRTVVLYLVLALLQLHSMESLSENTCAQTVDSYVPPKQIASNENRKLRWAVVALARPKGIDALKRNKLLTEKIRPYADRHDITIIVFSEQNFDSASLSNWQRPFAGLATVRYINTARHGWREKQRYGYKYMCKFFAMDIYEHLVEFDYYMRCDTDCFMVQLNYDIFQWAADNDVGYGFAVRKMEAHKPTKERFPKFVDNYIRRCNVKASAPMDFSLQICFNFYNNWHIGRVSFFTRPDVKVSVSLATK